MLNNPILPGFYPDPSICRAGDDYYIVNSSFELYPGIPISHSKDLMHWEQIGNVMDGSNGFHVERTYGAGGVMAPTIRYHDGIFYVICCNFSHGGNFIVTAENPAGPWSEPHWLQDVTGIDASLFFDGEQAYIVGVGDAWDGELGLETSGIYVAGFDIHNFCITTEKTTIFHSAMRCAEHPEAPHIYKKGEYYYLVIAEGGTDMYHCVTVGRSKDLFGTFEIDPANPVLTHRMMGIHAAVTNVGHADLVETQDGRWYAVMLASRSLEGKYKPLGRETYICPVTWDNDWPFFSADTGRLEMSYPDTGLGADLDGIAVANARECFEGGVLSPHWTCWGTPYETYYSVQNNALDIQCIPQSLIAEIHQDTFDLSITGRRKDLFAPFIAMRLRSMKFSAACRMHFEPADQESAGLALVQQMNNQYHLELACVEGQTMLQLTLYQEEFVSKPYLPGFRSSTRSRVAAQVPYEGSGIVLKITGNDRKYRFWYGTDEEHLILLAEGDAADISTEQIGAMTGTMAGMYATGNGKRIDNKASFEWFELKEE